MDKIIRELRLGILEGRIESLEQMRGMNNPKISSKLSRETIKKKHTRREEVPMGVVIPDSEVR